jgi:hypothetical protein
VSARESLPSPTSWRATVATKLLVTLPIRKRSVARIGVLAFRSA